jgi:hypothetical protein
MAAELVSLLRHLKADSEESTLTIDELTSMEFRVLEVLYCQVVFQYHRY